MPKPAADPFRYEIRAARGARNAEVLIYGDIGDSWMAEESVSAARLVREVAALEADYLDVRINSYGGAVADGLAIYNALRRHPAAVSVHVDGVAVSIASLIAMAGDTVSMAANAMMMVHAPWGMAMGDANVMRDYAETLDRFAQAMVSSYATKSGRPHDELLALLTDGQDHWYTAEEAVAAGFADEVAPALAAAASLPRDRFDTIPAAAAAHLAHKEANEMADPKHPEAGAAPADPENAPATEPTPEPTPAPAASGNVVELERAAEARALARLKDRNAALHAAWKPFLAQAPVREEYDAILADPEVTAEQASSRLLAKLAEGAGPAGPQGEVAASGEPTGSPEDRARARWDADPKLRAEFGDRFETFMAYERAAARGNIKILSKREA